MRGRQRDSHTAEERTAELINAPDVVDT